MATGRETGKAKSMAPGGKVGGQKGEKIKGGSEKKADKSKYESKDGKRKYWPEAK